jgi:hypothetical protein
MVRLRRKLSEEHKFIFSFIRNLQIFLVFGVILATLVLLEGKALGNVGYDVFQLLKYAYLIVFCLELLLTVVYQVCSYFWKQELFGVYIGKYYSVKGEVEEKDEQ